MSIINFSLNMGSLSVNKSIDKRSLVISFNFESTIPPEFQNEFYVLRGRYEYKTSHEDFATKIVYHHNSGPIQDFEITDDTIEAGIWYYYSIIFKFQKNSIDYFTYNPNTNIAKNFSVKDFGYHDLYLNKLPKEWLELSEDLTSRVVKIFTNEFEHARQSIETRLVENNIWYIDEAKLPEYASVIKWHVNRELNVEKQRREILKATETYKKTGRHEAITDLIEFITGWKVCIEEGYRRIFRVGDSLFNPDDSEQVRRRGLPWICVKKELLGVSDGSPSQTFTLDNDDVDRVIIYVGDDYFEEVEVFSGANQQFKLTGNIIEFGDGIDGEIPLNGQNIYAEYSHSGDIVKYIASDNWLQDSGFRIVIIESENGLDVTDVILNKIFRVIKLFKASYAIYEVVNLTGINADNELFGPFIDEFTDTEIVHEFLIMDEPNHNTDEDGYIIA